MPYKAKVYRVMIASPSDVAAERAIIRDVIHQWNDIHSDKEDIVLMIYFSTAPVVPESIDPKQKKDRRNAPKEDVVPASRRDLPALAREAREILAEASRDQTGTILKVRTTSGLTLQTNGRNLVDGHNARNEARWEAALLDLADKGLIRDRGTKKEVFSLTDQGYSVAEALRNQQGDLRYLFLPTAPLDREGHLAESY